ncbi:DoxX family protein [Paenibacillus alba]|uniref:DoxX family protein n=1 Tax=Paenibacillus alba TaxID=1197127 RepID=A0ABU6G032_9BACL|nr:DoxX family protein [Paenibacillus alba]MEC0227522.1 DoxX family protein [Paenibacillus alba]NQX66549.1 DoxX family protein [Paenibacillus alba]
MNIALWVLQVLLAFMFIMAGAMKLFQYEKFAAKADWAKNRGLASFIGIVEVLGGIGLIVPGLVGIAPVLTAFAALGIAIIMLLAVILHISRKEPGVGITIVLLLVSLFVAYGRFFLEPF